LPSKGILTTLDKSRLVVSGVGVKLPAIERSWPPCGLEMFMFIESHEASLSGDPTDSPIKCLYPTVSLVPETKKIGLVLKAKGPESWSIQARIGLPISSSLASKDLMSKVGVDSER